MPSNEIYLINGIKGLRKIRKPFLILWIDIKNKSEPLTCYDDLVRIIMIWCGRQELNLHGVNHKILSLARLPVPPRPRINGSII